MKRYISIKDHLFVPIKNGKSIVDSQGKPRIYESVESFERNAKFSFCDAELIEFAPIRWRDEDEEWHDIK